MDSTAYKANKQNKVCQKTEGGYIFSDMLREITIDVQMMMH